jgi:predicted heme/steroid binding protein
MFISVLPSMRLISAAYRHSVFICRIVLIFFTAQYCIHLLPAPAYATPEYADQTDLECIDCHVDPSGGSQLTETGTVFLNQLKAQGHRSLTFFQRSVRLIIGYLHMIAAIMWFGTIMYVHILLKPAYASQGLPKGELKVGWISMVVVLITGILLTIARVPSIHILYTTRFGILLSSKIALFLVMFSSAIMVTLFIGPKLRRKMQSPVADLFSQALSPEQLSHFDGKEGRPAYIAYKGIVYDVSRARLWKNGMHVMKHPAGNDLTSVLKSAPHQDDKILAMPQVGTLSVSSMKPKRPFHVRLFYFFAYMNLVLVFIITFIIALSRWW